MDVLNIGGMNVDGQQETVGIGDDVPLASMNPFARIEAARSAGLCRRSTLLSMTAAVGVGLRPSFRRACRTRALTILCHRPVSRQA
jgi:hypothetical protein